MLNSGFAMPRIGLGTWPLKGRQSTDAILWAMEIGYRLIDTAEIYDNEDSVGVAVRESRLPREELFITTKLRGRYQGAQTVREGLIGSLERLGLDYVDLFLIHWPLPRLGRYVETYAEMVKLADEGLIKSVGVSNFTAAHLDAVVTETGVHPAVDQLQVSPSFARTDLVDAIAKTPTIVQAWSPLERNSGVLENPTVTAIANRLGVTPSQVVIRWLIERGLTTVPHSSNRDRQRINADVFGFALTPANVAAITALDVGQPLTQDPDTWEEF